jgi:hypothetical protein
MRKKIALLLAVLVLIACFPRPAPAPPAGYIQTQAAGSTQPATTSTAVEQETAAPEVRIPPEQLDSLVAPIALYPDPLLSQTLVASTYPLEIIQLQQWLVKNPGLKDEALVKKVSKQDWDPSIQAMAALPDVVKRLADDIQWTTDLGNAFLAQQTDVMDAIQRMRQKAQGSGVLKSNDKQKVETRVVEDKTVVIVEQADPQVVYVPSYDPMGVWGEPYYPYPPIYYPPYGGAIAAGAIGFGLGLALGAAWGGGWGWGCGWGGNDIDINMNNNFNRNTNINRGDRTNIGGGGRGQGGKWQHNPKHRGGAPYRDQRTADRFGGSARGDSLANRQNKARDQVGRQGGNLGGERASTRPSGGDRGGSNFGGGGDRVGSRDIQKSSGGRDKSAFGGGGSGNFSGSKARSSSSRGSSSWGGGGFSRGGGGF